MEENTKGVGFKLIRIQTKEFASFKENFTSESLSISINLSVGVDNKNHALALTPSFTFLSEENKPILKISASCEFAIIPDKWKDFITGKSIIIPESLLKHLLMITIGTVRGILHARTENTDLNRVLLPTISVNELINKDHVVNFEDME
jgi:hypothetical protein